MAAIADSLIANQIVKRISKTMATHPTISALILVCTLMLLSDYVKSLTKPVIISQPLPKRFFPSSSLVLDYPYGNIGDVGDLLTQREALFVMYYAPWCAKSQQVREEFQKAAQYMFDDLQFVGVNAWYPNGTCRKQNHFSSYPVLYFYHLNRDGYRYTGIQTAEYMIQFAYKMLYPVKYIYNKDELVSFLAHRDNAVLGYFDFSSLPQPPGYLQFYYASLRVYENDPRNPIEFAVITSAKIAAFHKMYKSGTIHLNRSLNITVKYPSSYNLTSRNISNWVLQFKQGFSVMWMLPLGSKSSILSSQLNMPAVILFLPHYPLSSDNQYASLFREVALDYYNCNNLTHIPQVIKTLTYLRWMNAVHQLDINLECQDAPQVEPACRHLDRLIPTKRCCQSVMVDPSYTEYNSCDVCLNYLQTNPISWLPCDMKSVFDMPSWPYLLQSFPTQKGMCAELMPHYNPGEFLTVCCENHSYYNKAFGRSYLPYGKGRKSNDPFVINSVKNRHKNLCQRIAYQRKHGWEPPAVYFLPASDGNVTGYACLTNRTLSFLIMDTRGSHKFAQQLGINITSKSTEPVLVIFDKQMEEQFVMETRVTKSNIITFVKNFTEHALKRSWRSSTLDNQEESCHDRDREMCVLDVNSDNFKEVVMDPQKDVMVLYHTPWCGYCISFNHVYLSLAKYFRHSENLLFVRVDASQNDLPWQYTMDVYPTLVLFPAHRKSESMIFPDHLYKNLPNLIHFILQHSSTMLRLHTGLSICSRTCITANLASSAQRIQSLNHIIANLVRSKHLLQKKIQLYKRNLDGRDSPDLDKESSSDSMLRILQWYHGVVTRRIKIKHLQLSEARHLHQVLLSTTGPYIERHKLSTILVRYEAYKRHFSHMEKDNVEEVLSIGRDFNNVASNHDEL